MCVYTTRYKWKKQHSDSYKRCNKITIITCTPTDQKLIYEYLLWPTLQVIRLRLLPVQLRNPDITYELFRRQLKGHLFQEA